MAVPISVEKLLEGRIVESNRIEFKAGWNPESIVHTVCAFANDIDNIGGGYVVIGVEEDRGMPILPVKGLELSSIDGICKDIVNKCSFIEPRYLPVIEHCKLDGRNIVLLWVPGGSERPYRCPVSFSESKKDRAMRAFYIRKGSTTLKAGALEEKELFERARNIPFDDCLNMEASIGDLDKDLIDNFLFSVNSKMYESFRSMSLEDEIESLRIVGGPREMRRPLNVGLLFFCNNLVKFFPYARIEVVWKPDPTGRGMEETCFSGPLHKQLANALQYIRNMFVREKVFKHPDRAEADRFFSYPFVAIEEALTNAVYHRSYQESEPITVEVTDRSLSITSLPGPDRTISDDDIDNLHLVSKFYRNRRIGDFLKELGLAEARNTGIPTIVEAMESNGSPPPVIETDADRRYFRIILQIHPSYLEEKYLERTGSINDGRRPNGSVRAAILELLADKGALSRGQIAHHLGYGTIPGNLNRILKRLLDEGVIELTEPENPNSPMQRLRFASWRHE